MAETNLPYILSFIIKSQGTLLDDTLIHEIFETIDSNVYPAPAGYSVNCVHSSVLEKAMNAKARHLPYLKKRIICFQANTSSKSPDELENLQYLDTEDPRSFSQSMINLHDKFGIKILGGCCGTDNEHIESLAQKVISKPC